MDNSANKYIYFSAEEVPIYFIPFQYLSWFYYGVENLVVNQWVGTPLCFSLNLTELEIPIPDNCFEMTGSLGKMHFSQKFIFLVRNTNFVCHVNTTEFLPQ